MLKDKVIVVIGGGGLLASEFCAAIVRTQGKVIVADRDPEAAARVVRQIGSDNRCAQAAEVEITSRASIRELVQWTSENYGGIDAVVNSAYPRNRNYGRKLEDVTYADFCENVSAHLGGYFLVAQQFAAYFRTQGAGNIVNIASIYGVMAPRFEIYESTDMTMPVEYALIKSGVVHLTRYLAKYLQGTRVRCNAISPGGIENGQPAEFIAAYNAHCSTKGMLNSTDVTGALLFLLSDFSQCVNGQNIIVDDGFSL